MRKKEEDGVLLGAFTKDDLKALFVDRKKK